MFTVVALWWHCDDTVVTVVILCSLWWHYVSPVVIVVIVAALWWHCDDRMVACDGHSGHTVFIVVALY